MGGAWRFKMVKKTDSYLRVKQRTQKQFDKFPMFFAFNNEQFEEGLKELKVKPGELLNIGSGGFIRKKDRAKFTSMNSLQDRTHRRLLENKKYVYDMFRYELANHEYCITYDDTDTLESVGLTQNDINKSDLLRDQLEKAKKDYLKSAGDC